MLLLVLAFSHACAKRPATVPKTAAPKGLENCIRNNHSFVLKEKYHVVQRGETLYRLSKNYGVSLEEIAEANSISDITQISAGQMIIIPGQKASGLITWPVYGKVSSGFGRRGFRRFHSGIDISAPTGTPIRAVADGLVVLSGKSLDGYSRYGKIVIVEHGDGIRTVYAHNQKNHVKTGRCVRAGEVIAEVGSSGNASGPHVHFEIRKEGRPVNPLKYLP